MSIIGGTALNIRNSKRIDLLICFDSYFNFIEGDVASKASQNDKITSTLNKFWHHVPCGLFDTNCNEGTEKEHLQSP